MSDTAAPSGSKRTPQAYYAREALDKEGLGWVIVTRFKSGGQIAESGVFLVDRWCLGVKNAHFDVRPAAGLESDLLGYYSENMPLEPLDAACARKFVEQAVAYAAQLGFSPHPDYKKACRAWGGIDPAQCAQTFTFGREGKPFYMRGPNESEAEAHRIVEQLERRCGMNQFDFLFATDPDEAEANGNGQNETQNGGTTGTDKPGA